MPLKSLGVYELDLVLVGILSAMARLKDFCSSMKKLSISYKAAQHDLTILKRKIAITFDNEPGVDCGAIKSKFFTLLLGDINERL